MADRSSVRGGELVELVTLLGEADVDDLLLNVAGTLVGYTMFVLAAAAYRKIRATRPAVS